jgi:hypothetical protein
MNTRQHKILLINAKSFININAQKHQNDKHPNHNNNATHTQSTVLWANTILVYNIKNDVRNKIKNKCGYIFIHFQIFFSENIVERSEIPHTCGEGTPFIQFLIFPTLNTP